MDRSPVLLICLASLTSCYDLGEPMGLEGQVWEAFPPEGSAGGPPGLSIVVQPMAYEGTSVVVVDGAGPGEPIGIVRSTAGIGLGPCPPPMGGHCFDLLEPKRAGTAFVSPAGMGSFEFSPPRGIPEGCFQAVAVRGPGGVDSELSNTACHDAHVFVDYRSLGTFVTPVLVEGGVTVTGSADLNLLIGNGLGIVGGSSDLRIDGSESVTFTFGAPATRVSYENSAEGDLDGDLLFGEAIVEVFDATGASLGSVVVDSTDNPKFVSDAFGGEPLSRFTVTADVDSHRIASLTYIPSP